MILRSSLASPVSPTFRKWRNHEDAQAGSAEVSAIGMAWHGIGGGRQGDLMASDEGKSPRGGASFSGNQVRLYFPFFLLFLFLGLDSFPRKEAKLECSVLNIAGPETPKLAATLLGTVTLMSWKYPSHPISLLRSGERQGRDPAQSTKFIGATGSSG
jgi:hypothetical protein